MSLLTGVDLDQAQRAADAAQDRLAARGVTLESLLERIGAFRVEIPSWGFGRGGTRFGRYEDGAEARTVQEKMHDAGLVHQLTGVTPTVACHFPWDGLTSEEWDETLRAIRAAGLRPGAVNSNSFSPRPGTMDERLKLGSLTNPFAEVREASVAHNLDCVGIMRHFGVKILSLWLHDGTNSPGQQSLYDQADFLDAALRTIHDALADDETLFIEYKLFEPGFYATAIADWGRAVDLAMRAGNRARVLVDMGHHAQGTNIEQIVALLVRMDRLGGFHFNDRKYADDDLAAGSIDPYQLFRVFLALVEADQRGLKPFEDVAFLVDQSHNVKNPVEEMIETVDNLQRAYVQALLVDASGLQAAREAGDPVLGDQLLRDAFFDLPADAYLKIWRHERGLSIDPLRAFREGGWEQRLRDERLSRTTEPGRPEAWA